MHCWGCVRLVLKVYLSCSRHHKFGLSIFCASVSRLRGYVDVFHSYTIVLRTSRHYIDVIMTTVASQITSLTIVYSIVYSGADQRKHQSSASLAFVRGIHRDWWIPHTKGQLRGKCFHLMTSSCVIIITAVWWHRIIVYSSSTTICKWFVLVNKACPECHARSKPHCDVLISYCPLYSL